MALRDEIADLFDGLLGLKKKGPTLPFLPPTDGHRQRGARTQPRLGAGARDTFASEVPEFAKPTLFSPAERPLTMPDTPGGALGYVSLPPHIHPSPTAKPWYERRAVSVEPGASTFILDYAVDTDSIVYWALVGTDQHLNSFYEFWLDGTIFEAISGAAQVGTILNPYRFPAAVRVNKSVRLRVYNFNPTPFTYEVLVAGWIDRKD